MDELDQNVSGTTPLGLLLLFSMIGLTWFLPRRTALIPLLITTCYIPLGQYIMVGGAHLQFFRILLLIAWIRVFSRGEMKGLVLTKMDRVFIWWLVVTLVIGSFTQPSDFVDRFIGRCGEVYNAAGVYFLIRCWLRSVEELIAIVRSLAWLIVPMTVSMVFERMTGRNLFAAMGGVPEYSAIRDGSYRAQGAFRHAILAGTCGVVLFPLFIALYVQGKPERWRAMIGIVCSIIIAYVASTSGALLALLGGIVALALWRYRYSMGLIRRGIVFTLIVLAIVMKAPIWYIFAKLSDVVGGTGWYRSFLIEQAVNHFDQWFIAGSLYTATWAPGGEMPSGNAGNTDIINQFVLEGLQGGIVKMILFITLIVLGFKNVGRFTHIKNGLTFPYRYAVWTLGACLLTHCLSFFSVTYFDQIIIMWYWLLAALAMLQNEFSRLAKNGGPEESALEGP